MNGSPMKWANQITYNPYIYCLLTNRGCCLDFLWLRGPPSPFLHSRLSFAWCVGVCDQGILCVLWQ